MTSLLINSGCDSCNVYLVLSTAENPQQDQKNLLCLREVDGERADNVYFYESFMWCNGARLVLCIFQDPSRNHRAYRLAVAKLTPPYIPFMPLLLKGNRCQQLYGSASEVSIKFIHRWHHFCLFPDMTFINEGNPNCVDRLVNFEKMVRLKYCLTGYWASLFRKQLVIKMISIFSSDVHSAWSRRQWKSCEDAEASLTVSGPVG